MTGIERIAAERQRQLDVEGWDADHDRGHADELATAAACYALPPDHLTRFPSNGQVPPPIWPWNSTWWKPVHNATDPATARVRELEKAGALIAAAIDSLQEPVR